MIRLNRAKGNCKSCAHCGYCEWAQHIDLVIRTIGELVSDMPDIQLAVNSCKDYKEKEHGS